MKILNKLSDVLLVVVRSMYLCMHDLARLPSGFYVMRGLSETCAGIERN